MRASPLCHICKIEIKVLFMYNKRPKFVSLTGTLLIDGVGRNSLFPCRYHSTYYEAILAQISLNQSFWCMVLGYKLFLNLCCSFNLIFKTRCVKRLVGAISDSKLEKPNDYQFFTFSTFLVDTSSKCCRFCSFWNNSQNEYLLAICTKCRL